MLIIVTEYSFFYGHPTCCAKLAYDLEKEEPPIFCWILEGASLERFLELTFGALTD